MRIAIALTLALLMTTAAEAQSKRVPVMVGGDDGVDACMSLGEVVGLNPKGDNFLAVRRGPGTKYKKIDEIHTGDEIFVCDEKGDWYGVVYPDLNEDEDMDCEVSSPIEERDEYSGDCISGWVHSRYVEIIAG